MAYIRFAGLVLGVIIVSLALKYSSACTLEGGERKGKWLPSIATQNHASSQNDLHDEISASSVAKIGGRKVLGGRNTRKGELLKREIEKKEGSNERPEISGATCSARSCYNFEGKSSLNRKHTSSDETNLPKKFYMVGLVSSRADYHGKDAPKKSSKGAEHYHSNTQDNSEVSQKAEKEIVQKEYAYRKPGYSPNSTPLNSLHFKAASSKASVFDEHHDESAQKDDSKEFLEAADEVVNLMRKDYTGMNRPRRKPPINNHKPTD